MSNDRKIIPFKPKTEKAPKNGAEPIFSPHNMIYFSEHEAMRLYAVMAFTARVQNTPMNLLTAFLEVRLDIDDIHKLPSSAYDDAMRLMYDLHEKGTPVVSLMRH